MLYNPLIELSNFLNKIYAAYKFFVTAYADDIIISSEKKINKSLLTNLLIHFLRQRNKNYKLKKEKTFTFTKGNRHILGINFNSPKSTCYLTKPKKYKKEVYFRPLIEKYLHCKINKRILNQFVVGKLNECLRYEIYNFYNSKIIDNNIKFYPLHRYIFKFSNYNLLKNVGLRFIDKEKFKF